MTADDKAFIKIQKELAKLRKYDVVIFADETANNGEYNPNTDEIAVNLKGEYAILQTAAHELVHHMEETNPNAYDALVDFVVNSYGETETLDVLVKRQQELARNSTESPRELSYAGAVSEVVANACQNVLNDKSAFETLINNGGSELAKTLREWIDSFIQTIKKALESVKRHSIEYNTLLALDADMKELQRLFNEGLVGETNVSGVTNGTEAKYSLRNTKSMSWKEQISRYFEIPRLINRSDTLYMGETPSFLTIKEIENLPLAIPLRVIGKSQSGKDIGHSVSKQSLLSLKNGIENAIAVVVDYGNNAIIFVTNIKQDEMRLVVSFKRNSIFDGDNVHVATSIHLRNDIMPMLSKINDKSKIYIHKNDESEITSRGSTNYERVQDKIEFIEDILLQKEQEVKENSEREKKLSVRETMQDSNGKELTPEQAEFFKESKVRNEDGDLLIVYHGTSEKFTVFDNTKGRANMDIQGSFFSPWAEDAKGYGKYVDSYYLNIANPANEDEAYKALNMFKGQNGAGIKAREFLKILGYDGVNNGNEEYVAFYPEQIKRTDNHAPTGNEDVRYSYRESFGKDDEYLYDNLIKKPDMSLTVIDDTSIPPPSREARKKIIATAKKNAALIGTVRSDGSVSVNVSDINNEVVLSTGGLKHGLDRRFQLVAPIVINSGKILSNAIKINDLTSKKATASKSYVLLGAAKNSNNDLYIVSFIVNRHTNELLSVDVLDSINAKTESAGSLSPRLTEYSAADTDSKISISSFLEIVNEYFPDVLPMDVLNHFGHDKRPSGKIGESALFSYREFKGSPEQASREQLEKTLAVLEEQFKLTHGERIDRKALREFMDCFRPLAGKIH
ncbi:MAG TPA: hypothetical protein VFD25_03715 [Clostridia bacterium]|nr:hypothetical protein [Clostridia bacterium]